MARRWDAASPADREAMLPDIGLAKLKATQAAVDATDDAKRDIGAELLASVREMNTEVRGRTHQPVVSEVVRACLASVNAFPEKPAWSWLYPESFSGPKRLP